MSRGLPHDREAYRALQSPVPVPLIMVLGHAGTTLISIDGAKKLEILGGHTVVYCLISRAPSVGINMTMTRLSMVSQGQYILPRADVVILSAST